MYFTDLFLWESNRKKKDTFDVEYFLLLVQFFFRTFPASSHTFGENNLFSSVRPLGHTPKPIPNLQTYKLPNASGRPASPYTCSPSTFQTPIFTKNKVKLKISEGFLIFLIIELQIFRCYSLSIFPLQCFLSLSWKSFLLFSLSLGRDKKHNFC